MFSSTRCLEEGDVIKPETRLFQAIVPKPAIVELFPNYVLDYWD